MSVETATYINQLDATLPGINDPKSEGDDHLRLIKGAVKATFPNLTATPVTPTSADLNTVAGASSTGAVGFNVQTQASTDNTTKAASTAMVQAAILASSGISASLPAQSGNAGSFLQTNGTTASWATSGIGQVGSTVTANTTLTSASAGYQFVQMASLGQSITLPDATTLSVGGPRYIIDNTKGGYPAGIRDNTGTLIMAVAAGGEAFVSLKDNSTAAGSWSVTGSNLEPGLITIDSTFSSTYQSTVLAPFVALDNNTSIHFAALSSGFAAFVVDNTGKVVSTPVTVSSTSGEIPRVCFKVSATSAILFYGASTPTFKAVVLTLSGATPAFTLSVGTPVTAASPNIQGDTDDFIGAPKVAQLSSTSYIWAFAGATGVSASVQAFSVSGATVTAGSAATIHAATAVPGSTTVYPLTSTTALVLHKLGSAAPYTNYATVISVSGTTCTVNTPVALTGCASAATAPPCSTLVSATKCIVADDNNSTTGIFSIALSISGTSVSAGSALQVGAPGLGSGSLQQYTSSNATRYNPHLWTLTTGATNTVGLWYLDSSGVSRVVVLSETSGTITAGTIVYKSISSATQVAALGGGNILPQSSTEFLAIKSTEATSNSSFFQAQASKISGSAITQGGSKFLDSVLQGTSPISIVLSKTLNGDYLIITVGSAGNFGQSAIPVLRSNGDVILYRGLISTPGVVFGSSANPAVSQNRLVLLGSAYGTTVGTTTYQLRLLNVEIAA